MCVYDIFSGKRYQIFTDVLNDSCIKYEVYAQQGKKKVVVIYNVSDGTHAKIIDLTTKAIMESKITNDVLPLDSCSIFFPDNNNLMINYAETSVYNVNLKNAEIKNTTLSSYYPSKNYLIKQKTNLPTLQLVRLNNDMQVERNKIIGDIFQYADAGETMFYTIQGNRYVIRNYHKTNDDYRTIVTHTNGDIYLYDGKLKTHRFVYSFRDMEKQYMFWNISVNKKCNTFAISTNDSVYIMSLVDLKHINKFKTQHINYSKCVFSPYGNLIYLGNDSIGYIYNSINGKQVCQLDGRPCFNITFSPSDTYLACTLDLDEDAALAMFDASSGKQLWISKDIFLNGESSYSHVKFSSDGKYVACVNEDLERGIMVFDVLSGRVIAILKHHTKEINSIDFCSDDNYLISSAQDEDICLWNIKEQQVVQVFHPIFGNNADVEFTSEKFIRASCKYEFGDTHIIEYPFYTLKEIIERNKKRFKNRKLTHKERQKYYLE